MTSDGLLTKRRRELHAEILADVLRYNREVPSNADGSSRTSVLIASAMAKLMAGPTTQGRMAAQSSGRHFERVVADFITDAFALLRHIRPGDWSVETGNTRILRFEQYKHLGALTALSEIQPEVAIAIGRDYLIKPDIIVARRPEPDEVLNAQTYVVDEQTARLSPLRATKRDVQETLHASISCKWSLRSDRAQNARTEALNLIRNRKGKLPHIAVVTFEPLPGRLASLAYGTGDIDCVYHVALLELHECLRGTEQLENQLELLEDLIQGDRIRDIADLPIDLAS